MADQSQRTESPTQRRLEKARKEGQFPASKEFVGALQFIVFVAILGWGGAHWFSDFRQTTRELIAMAFTAELTAAQVTQVTYRMLTRHVLPLALSGMVVALATMAFRLITTRFGVSLKKLSPDLKRLNPLTKLKDLPKQNIPALIQAVLMLPLFLWAVYVIARDRLDAFLVLPL